MARPKSKTLHNKYSDSALTKNLREMINSKNISGLAEACGGITETSIRSWTSGETRPDIDKLPLIAEYFDVTIDYLMGISKISSRDVNVQDACKITGLSELAIKQLQLFSLELEVDRRKKNVASIQYKMLMKELDAADKGDRDSIEAIFSKLEKNFDEARTEVDGEWSLVAIEELLIADNGLIALQHLGRLFYANSSEAEKALAFANAIDFLSAMRHTAKYKTEGDSDNAET